MSENILLICTVGGSPEPLVATIKHWKPQKIIFIASPETKDNVDKEILTCLKKNDIDIANGSYTTYQVSNSDNFLSTVKEIRRHTEEAYEWTRRGEEYKIIVDFTGGKKPMTAALALQASKWPCMFSYVGGNERNKDGVGTVVSGKEVIILTKNPWDYFGYVAIEEAVAHFNKNSFQAASEVLDVARKNVGDASTKRAISSLKTLIDAYAEWDRFNIEKAFNLFEESQKGINDFLDIFGQTKKQELENAIHKHTQHLKKIDKNAPTKELILDLLANANRRMNEGRYEDGVARLYRAIEAIAQLRLKELGFENTSKIKLETLPESFLNQRQFKTEEPIKLGLQEDYQLLLCLNDPAGKLFQELGLGDKNKSPLNARNNSILAHGFNVATKDTFAGLWGSSLKLANISETDLPKFPNL